MADITPDEIEHGGIEPSTQHDALVARIDGERELARSGVLDVQLGKDACTVGDPNAAANLGALRRLALMLARRETTFARGSRPKSVRAKQTRSMRSAECFETLLTAGIIEGLMQAPRTSSRMDEGK